MRTKRIRGLFSAFVVLTPLFGLLEAMFHNGSFFIAAVICAVTGFALGIYTFSRWPKP